MSRSHQEAIKKHWNELIEYMDVEKVEDYMISKNKLRLSEREELNRESEPQRRQSALLHYVQSQDLNVFNAFWHGLVAAGQSYLAEMLRSPWLQVGYGD